MSMAFVTGGRFCGIESESISSWMVAELDNEVNVSEDVAGDNLDAWSANQTTSGARNDGVPILFKRSFSGNSITSSG